LTSWIPEAVVQLHSSVIRASAVVSELAANRIGVPLAAVVRDGSALVLMRYDAPALIRGDHAATDGSLVEPGGLRSQANR
jgi:hypothetical protein